MREKGLAESSGAAAKWLLDRLIIDQDVVQTLAELKRGANSEVRRTEAWAAPGVRSARLGDVDSVGIARGVRARGRDDREEPAALLRTNEEPKLERFRETVSTNLAAKRLRLLFVADDIPDPLARTVALRNCPPWFRLDVGVTADWFAGRRMAAGLRRAVGGRVVVGAHAFHIPGAPRHDDPITKPRMVRHRSRMLQPSPGPECGGPGPAHPSMTSMVSAWSRFKLSE